MSCGLYNFCVLVYHVEVLEACVKNCGAPMHKEVATKEMMDNFRELAKVSTQNTLVYGSMIQL